MGNQLSYDNPVQSHPDSFVAVSICVASKIRIMNAPPEVHAMFVTLDQEITAKWGSTRAPIHEYYGTLKMQIGDWTTFYSGSGKNSGTLGKYFALRCFEEMYKLGYNLAISADLARKDDNATWYFTKSIVPAEDRSNPRICCIAPGGARSDKLVLLRHDERIKEAVTLAVQEAWPKGVEAVEEVESLGETLHEIKLHGYFGGVEDDGVNTRKLICNLVGRMGAINWRLVASANLKGTADSYFFIYDPGFTAQPSDFCMIALSKHDRFRLINCNELAEPLKETVTAAGYVVEKELEYFGCYEIKVNGDPWWSEGPEAIQARRTISRIMEMMGRQCYSPYYAVDVTRRQSDKASILFRRTGFPVNCKYACLSLSDVARIRLLDFPVPIGVPIRAVIYEQYPFGVVNEVQLPDSNLEVNLAQWPWVASGQSKGYAPYHARALLGRMMRVAEEHGWHVSISADVSAKMVGAGNDSYSLDVHTIYFVKLE